MRRRNLKTGSRYQPGRAYLQLYFTVRKTAEINIFLKKMPKAFIKSTCKSLVYSLSMLENKHFFKKSKKMFILNLLFDLFRGLQTRSKTFFPGPDKHFFKKIPKMFILSASYALFYMMSTAVDKHFFEKNEKLFTRVRFPYKSWNGSIKSFAHLI